MTQSVRGIVPSLREVVESSAGKPDRSKVRGTLTDRWEVALNHAWRDTQSICDPIRWPFAICQHARGATSNCGVPDFGMCFCDGLELLLDVYGIMIMALVPSSLVSMVFCMLLAKEALSRGAVRWWQLVLIGAFSWFAYSVATAVYIALFTDGAWDTFFALLPYLLLNDWLRGALAGLTVWLIGVVGNVQPVEGSQSESV